MALSRSWKYEPLSKSAEHPAHKTWLLRLKSLEFTLVQPKALIAETLVNANIAENNLLKLQTALRAPPEVKSSVAFPLFSLQLRLVFLGDSAPALHFLLREVLFLIAAWLYGHSLLGFLECEKQRLHLFMQPPHRTFLEGENAAGIRHRRGAFKESL